VGGRSCGVILVWSVASNISKIDIWIHQAQDTLFSENKVINSTKKCQDGRKDDDGMFEPIQEGIGGKVGKHVGQTG
jgi:hypothetical protein